MKTIITSFVAMLVYTYILTTIGCSSQPSQSLPTAEVSLHVRLAKLDDGRIEITCQFSNSGKQDVLIGEEMNIAYTITSQKNPQYIEISSATDFWIAQLDDCTQYTLLSAVPPHERNQKIHTWPGMGMRRRFVIQEPSLELDDALMEVSAQIVLLEYDSQKKTFQTKLNSLLWKGYLSEIGEAGKGGPEKAGKGDTHNRH